MHPLDEVDFDVLGANFSRPTGSLRQRPKRQKVYTMCPVQNVYDVSVLTGTLADVARRSASQKCVLHGGRPTTGQHP